MVSTYAICSWNCHLTKLLTRLAHENRHVAHNFTSPDHSVLISTSPEIAHNAKTTCSICFRSFTRPKGLQKHMRSHITERSFACTQEDCTKKFKTVEDCEAHIQNVHLKIHNYVCSVDGCTATFNSGHKLRRHVQTVHKGGLRCSRPGCKMRFRNQNTLNRHIREHDGLRPYVCSEPDCDKSFSSRSSLGRHVKSHTTSFHWCSECNNEFNGMKNLRLHCKRMHIPCSFCDKVFDSREEMHDHVSLKHSNQDDSFSCTECPKIFTRRSNLNAHYRSAHQGYRFSCGKSSVSNCKGIDGWTIEQGCGKQFTTKVKLIEHIRFQHLYQPRLPASERRIDILDDLSGTSRRKMEAVYKCLEPGCGLRFKRVTDFEKHSSVHLNSIFRSSASLNSRDSVLIRDETGKLDEKSTSISAEAVSFKSPVSLSRQTNYKSGVEMSFDTKVLKEQDVAEASFASIPLSVPVNFPVDPKLFGAQIFV